MLPVRIHFALQSQLLHRAYNPVFTSLLLHCAASPQVAHRYYDTDHNDYHRWNNNETVYHNQWVIESRVEPHRQYKELSREDQKQYWEWRHNHHDHDHDRDQDRDHHHRQ
jgi:hypothetical protein